jgi:hypothetical protein
LEKQSPLNLSHLFAEMKDKCNDRHIRGRTHLYWFAFCLSCVGGWEYASCGKCWKNQSVYYASKVKKGQELEEEMFA